MQTDCLKIGGLLVGTKNDLKGVLTERFDPYVCSDYAGMPVDNLSLKTIWCWKIHWFNDNSPTNYKGKRFGYTEELLLCEINNGVWKYYEQE